MTRQRVCGSPAAACFKFTPLGGDALRAFNEGVCGLRPGHAGEPEPTRHEYVARGISTYKLVWPDKTVFAPPAPDLDPPDRSVCTCVKSEVGQIKQWCMGCLTDKVRRVRGAK